MPSSLRASYSGLEASYGSLPRAMLWRMALAAMLGLLCLIIGLGYWQTRAKREAARAAMQQLVRELGRDSNALPVDGKAVPAAMLEAARGNALLYRLTEANGARLREITLAQSDGLLGYGWAALPPPTLPLGTSDWQRLSAGLSGPELWLARYAMSNGRTLWYGRTNDTERQAVFSTLLAASLLALLVLPLLVLSPLLWLSWRVARPLHKLALAARQGGEATASSLLVGAAALPEVKALALAFGENQDRIAALASELHSVNDHLAHELKTPLARVRANVEGLLDRCDDEASIEAATLCLEEIDRASGLVRDILAIRLGASGAMRLNLQLTSAFEFLSDIVEGYTPAAEEKDLELVFECESEALILLDQQRVRQAITNLIDNAFAYTPATGEVRVILRATNEEGLTMLVLDSGPGLTAADMQRIWKRFERGSAGASRREGTGLGLPLVRAVANAHHGDAGCANRPEGGAEFWFWLPGEASQHSLLHPPKFLAEEAPS